MKKAIYYIVIIPLIWSYVNCYSKVYAKTHEKQAMPQFIFPAACHYGQDCWAVNYVDVDPDEGDIADFKCKTKTYDNHKGTDFALGSITQMREGVNVLAAASGKVVRVRDGQSDSLKNEDELESIRKAKKECGNGILIDHGNGLQTMYCHLKNGSLLVKPGQKVQTGQDIAQIGQSGAAEFPHLHFSVFWEGGVVDPYTGLLNTDGCGKKKASMWHIGLPMKYEPVAIFDGGFQSKPPDFKAIQSGSAPNPSFLALNSAAFVFWSGFYNVEKGDEVTLVIYDPDGEKFHSRTQSVEKTRARQYYYTGRKIGRVQLKKGAYKGVVTLTRGALTRERTFSIQVK